jgi:predicted Zn finger-like uncharacterized protein
MKITCQACQAKYTIADEKVVGKIVKIRCKKCGATIVVNGSDASGSSPPGPGGAFDYTAEGTAQAAWMVNVADGDQRTMTEQEIAVAYRAGVVSDDTFCWREGMGDWQPIQEIALLHAACTAAGPAQAGEAGAASAKASSPSAAKDGNGAPAGPPPVATTAARRTGGRAAADLFSGAAKAGGEDEVMTSAPAEVRQAHADGQKPTGARNENSLLFALKEKGGTPAPPSMTATTEASGLIDIRQLGAQMRSTADEKKKSRVDDIMNLGGGAFSPSLAAPVLSAPSLEHYSQPPPGMLSSPAAAQVKNTALIVLVACLAVFSLVAAGGIVWLLAGGKTPVVAEDNPKPPASASAAAATTSTSVGSAAASAAPSAVATASASAPAGTASESATAAPSETASAPPAAAAPKETQPKEAAPAPKPAVAAVPKEPAAPAPPSGGAEFNMGEVRARLASVAAGVQSCKRGETTGSGRVEISFGPSGAVQSATLMPGSPFDGTPTGKCVEARFRQARVPAFTGSPVAVTKSFSIN